MRFVAALILRGSLPSMSGAASTHLVRVRGRGRGRGRVRVRVRVRGRVRVSVGGRALLHARELRAQHVRPAHVELVHRQPFLLQRRRVLRLGDVMLGAVPAGAQVRSLKAQGRSLGA